MQYGRRRKVIHALSRYLIQHPFKGSVRLQNALGRLLLPRPIAPSVAPTLYGFDMKVDPAFDKGLEEALYYYGTYEPGTLWVIEHCLRPGDCFFDIGSNIGLMAVFAARQVGERGHVYAFEPDGDTFGILQQNLELNHLSNVQPFQLALGSTRDTKLLHRALNNRGMSSLVEDSDAELGTTTVSVNTLDGFLSLHSDHVPRMLKVDVEGWELEVLRGGRSLLSSPQAPILCIEYSQQANKNERNLLDLYEHLTIINRYAVFKLVSGKERISPLAQISSRRDLPFRDNLFCFLDSHLAELPHSLFVR